MSEVEHSWCSVELSAEELGFDEGTVIEVQFRSTTQDGDELEAVRGSLEGLRASPHRTMLLVRHRGVVHEVPGIGAYEITFPYDPDGQARLQRAHQDVRARLV